MNPARLLLREARGSSRDGPRVGQSEESKAGKTGKNDQESMCTTTTLAAVGMPASAHKGGVKIVRMSRGKRMSEEAFDSLPEKEKIRVLRNRRNALQTRARRQARITELAKENALLEASAALKEKQIAVLLSLLGGVAVKAEREDKAP